ncbi:DUF3817 domain-containing protein [Streptomyces sp. ACA25]|uniref:DUF3817 domain-containing protein n=1 Tax=Streptomyces sp. ACA25 TaxID=3022596 RepID=UPI002307C92A|nr:DUF3817 domain-containing protein [Streptomyces sp. ACA25]MDB1088547.1 DUF3817 domain-containing protein [Streptomyces sp. ACA25]
MGSTTTVVEQPAGTGSRLLRWFTVVAVFEAFTWAGLLIGMYFKYIPETTELGVRIFGSLHGAAFIAYLAVTCLVAFRLRWPIRWTVLFALAASVPPFMTVVFEMWARRKGYLDARRAVREPSPAS